MVKLKKRAILAAMEPDIRWIQRMENYASALSQLEKAVALSRTRPLTPLEEQGLVQAFEFTHELAWNVMKDYFAYQGNTAITGSRDATREAFSLGLVADGDGWMEMINSRSQSSHTYNEQIAVEITRKVIKCYFELFIAFKDKMEDLKRRQS